ncbi:methylenetetrahydrofolate reductase [Dehalobacterium formicoaceticum]|uniref:Methylenetetrahydrofolate reductase n=1 Tax=Dehalobacterium formicoaceticum TaxID=51515 RepID=A0ABT1Y915_9FIRM|nr:methylenetetrahydrofolate reductase [Dehalobacterium formicoaceticum]MCR6546976.1 methylenetetrahydrofolate reductase [Dehalobacterium formicoaceticum]
MRNHIKNKIYLVETLPPKQDTERLEDDLQLFAKKFNKVMKSGYCACIGDNPMGNLYFKGIEIIEELKLDINPEQVIIHLNTFHTKEDLHSILDRCESKGIKYLLVLSGDGSERLPKLQPSELGIEGMAELVTSVELLKYIKEKYQDTFILGVAFNPYKPKEPEFNKLQKKIDAGASFIITQPIIERNAVVDEVLEKYLDVPLIVEAWMSKNLRLLSDIVGYEVVENTQFNPIETLKMLHTFYPKCGFYLSFLGFKSQYHLIENIWI